MSTAVRAIGVIVLGIALFYAGVVVSHTDIGESLLPAGYVESYSAKAGNAPFDTSLMWEAFNVLDEHYINIEEVTSQQLLYGAVSGMIDAVSDPHTTFMKPKDSERFLADVSGEFEGVGMEVGMRDGSLTVVSPLEGTPADKAGMKAGDKILEIGTTSTSNLSLDEAVNMIRGKEGTDVVLTVLRGEWESTREISITRSTIEIPSVEWELKSNGRVAHIKLFHFTQTLDAAFREAAMEAQNSSAEAIVLDLRNNPGGFLQVSQNVAGWFLPRGETVAIEKFASGREKKYRSPGPAKLSSYPVTVLINEGSASASEILAAALRDNADATIVGTQSFGKGSVQEVKKLSDGSSIKVTIAHWLTPEGDLIEGSGITPDVSVEQSATSTDDVGQTDEEEDRQLQRAIETVLELR